MAAWACRETANEHERQKTGRRDRPRRGDAARERHRDHLGEPHRGEERREPHHEFRHHGLRGRLRLRAEGLHPVRLDRAQAGAAHGPLRPDDHGGGAPGRVGLRARRRARGRPRRRGDRDGDRRPEGVPGLLRPAPRARPRPGQPVLDPADHPEHGRRLGLDGARHARPALVPVHCLRGFEHGHRGRHGLDQARPRGRHVLRRHRGRDHEGRHRRLHRDAGALAAEGRLPRRRAVRSTRAATGS